MLIRHGEKPDGGPDLSVRGSSRAGAIPSLFANPPPNTTLETSCRLATGNGQFSGSYPLVDVPTGTTPASSLLPPPDFLFAAMASKSSNRPVETITPLATALGQTIDASFDDDAYQSLADAITSKAYAGKTVLVCWHHGKMADLAQSLGVSPKPKKPSGTVFDRLWLIDYSYAAGTRTVTFTDGAQWLLYGDSSS